MSDGRMAFALFCDDIRQERGNKFSLMGCYGPEVITETIPISFPRLCVMVRAVCPMDSPFKKLHFRAFLGDDLIGEISIPEDELATGHRGLATAIDDDADHRMSVAIFMAFSPLSVNQPTKLRTEVETDSGTLKAGAIRIRPRTPQDPAF